MVKLILERGRTQFTLLVCILGNKSNEKVKPLTAKDGEENPSS
jgi:hypothetical protein